MSELTTGVPQKNDITEEQEGEARGQRTVNFGGNDAPMNDAADLTARLGGGGYATGHETR